MAETALVLFTQDLRVHDHPALARALEQNDRAVPVFVLDPALTGRASRNRNAYLADALADLRATLRARGGELFVRQGETAEEVHALAQETGATDVHLSAGVSRTAQRRLDRLSCTGLRVHTHPGLTVVPPGALTPVGGDHYKVFTPYWRAWEGTERRPVLPAPDRVPVPSGPEPGTIPGHLPEEGRGVPARVPLRGGEARARTRRNDWLDGGLAEYPDRHDDLPGRATSQLSADLRFGCLSALELERAAHARGGDAYVRQLAWRDFHHQVTAAFPGITVHDYRDRGRTWHEDPDALEAWKQGRTGVPIVDAGMRQLLDEGFMHNRARMITAAFLTRTLRVHWRHGVAHFDAHLYDGDVADDHGNWQWVAGTGNDTRPNRGFNPLRQARRFDPEGVYVRRHVPELADLPGRSAHTPWAQDPPPPGYPEPIADPEGG
ncbi:deoxyribodipyrimidine photo-lyase [Nocardiopsis sp. HNM0947]|uniref:Deoxyribodipyrimidine photo-lyase n=1 Tax=Nocardiopsis coralli TaxID=2772213 RepID=A0ABR9P4L6_9ACTN|nr:deoxyribodipyrimidine photo-lyase [Nocardiopsis coralli]MBE2998752.1 deoxyribodipyrimidine photo-lyase [Nocardiopsis coralli]